MSDEQSPIKVPVGDKQAVFSVENALKKPPRSNPADSSSLPQVVPPQRKTYPQDWTAYNLYQTQEKKMFLKILDSVVDAVEFPEVKARVGRPMLNPRDVIKSMCIKVYTKMSARRVSSELELPYALRYIKHVPYFNSILNHMNNPRWTPYLHSIIKMMSEVVVPIERRFSTDSTGVSTHSKERWITIKGAPAKQKDFKKFHISIGNRTHIITSVVITDANKGDAPQFKELLNTISKQFTITHVSADAGYLSKENVKAVEEIGAEPFIKIKSNTKKKAGLGAWGRMVRKNFDNPQSFKHNYNDRSNVEATFSMLGRKFDFHIRSKRPDAQVNEILCRAIVHNIVAVIAAHYKYDLKVGYLC